MLLAANHPNSFLDGIILTTLFDNTVFSLARGDAFKYPLANKVLRSLKLLPVYRTSEGVENLEHNYTTFDDCLRVFEKNGIVLIFSEGRCENEWHLRRLKKGTARLATAAWNKNIALQVVPLGFNYSSFKQFGKDVHLNFGEPITAAQINSNLTEGKQWLQFNELLQQQLQQLVYEIDENDTATLKTMFEVEKGVQFYLLLLPAAVGFVIHVPLFYACKLVTVWRFKNSGHYDSVLTALLLLAYPPYYFAICIFLFLLHPFLLMIGIFAPLLARAWVWVNRACCG